MYPQGSLVQVVKNTNCHWFAIGENIIVGEHHPNKKLYPHLFHGIFHGKPILSKTEKERHATGGGPWVRLDDVILIGPELSLEEMLRECLE
jgi:hypothetical protein